MEMRLLRPPTLVLALASSLLLAPPAALLADAPPPPDPAPAAADGHPVGAEDLLEISVFEIPALNRIVRVSDKGTISLPLLGELRVEGLAPTQLEEQLRRRLSEKYLQDPQVSVFVREHGSRKVSVLGAVGKPGVYEMLGQRTLLEILSLAGGLTKEAGGQLFVLRRTAAGVNGAAPGALDAAADSAAGSGHDAAAPEAATPATAEKVAVDILDLMAQRDHALNIGILPGDIISVPIDRPVYVYVDGAVKTPGRIEQLESRPITLLQAIAKAGGANDRANLKKVQILRQGADGNQAVLPQDAVRIAKGKLPDPVLQDGDVVVVPETFF